MAGLPADPVERDPHLGEQAAKQVCGSQRENPGSRYPLMGAHIKNNVWSARINLADLVG